ncbi:conserved hypothetical protein [Culex quinquefasciatus]|uniref:Uncharacterized protein n=1 Tax=Culex quinquefasciatus TaxID=7176 RepID=B0XBH3_CULQU|nr:conserved hypothetical protein [Culex quinquefasciatus]|eukprot:XP_001866995.1 conserved hypothetical protein [Culex quinquefasciatus]
MTLGGNPSPEGRVPFAKGCQKIRPPVDRVFCQLMQTVRPPGDGTLPRNLATDLVGKQVSVPKSSPEETILLGGRPARIPSDVQHARAKLHSGHVPATNEYANLCGKVVESPPPTNEKPVEKGAAEQEKDEEGDNISLLVQNQTEAAKTNKKKYRFESVVNGAKNICSIKTGWTIRRSKILQDAARTKKYCAANSNHQCQPEGHNGRCRKAVRSVCYEGTENACDHFQPVIQQRTATRDRTNQAEIIRRTQGSSK